jgi:hypothetical protein
MCGYGASVLLAVCLGLGAAGQSQAAALNYCSASTPLSAAQQDRVLRFAGIAKDLLEASGQQVAIVSRSGIDLGYFGQRYSHAGVSLKASANTPWSIRQLYFACDEQRPRIFDQGLSGFLQGGDEGGPAYLSLLFLPTPQAQALEAAALNNALSLQLLGAQYSANAFAFSTLYQNCNQWLAELLAVSWAKLPSTTDNLRARAQDWLVAQGYVPSTMQLVWRPLLWLTAFSNLVHADDHPQADLDDLRLRVSMPASIEAFVQATVPGATRIELCRTETHVVIHPGWTPLAKDCVAGPEDQVIRFDQP